MAIKKYTNGSWVPANYRKYGTETDTITILPATVIGDGTPISSYVIKGNMEQSGTPTPSNPIYPSECGEKTENLFDKDDLMNNYSLDGQTGLPIAMSGRIAIVNPIELSNDYITIKWNSSKNLTLLYSLFQNGQLVTRSSSLSNPLSINVTSIEQIYLCWLDTNAGITKADILDVMVVKGLTVPTSYIPYGYKLPLTLGNTTTDIYLGEVQSTRRIKKLVLTGEENWVTAGVPIGNTTLYQLSVPNLINVGNVAALDVVCTYFECGSYYGASTEGVQHSFFTLIFRSAETTLENWKTFLAQQYANGTPVTVWYVLANPATGIVNEPIRKIGDYVDSVSGTGLATSGTAQQFDVGTTLKPSEVDMTYHGWHEHEDTKYST